MLQLTAIRSHSIPLEAECLTPAVVRGLTPDEVAELVVFHGNRRGRLGDWFRSEGDAEDSEIRVVGDCSHVKGIAAGMTDGRVIVEGNVGLHAGAGMRGGELLVRGNAGDWLGAEMNGGLVRVTGSVGHLVGAAYRGSRSGMTGGTIHIAGSAGDEVGMLMRRGLIVIGGDCGEFAGASMIAGSIFIGERAGARLGAGMKRGTIFAGAVDELPSSFRFACEYKPSILSVYRKQLASARVGLPALRAGAVNCYRGDLLHAGRGEVFIPA